MIRILALGIIAFTFLMSEEISIGSKMPGSDYILKNINGDESELSTFKKENGLLVVFSCNTCPYVIRWQDRYNPISELCSKNDIGFVAVNSNASQHDGVDSFDSMKEHADKYKYMFPNNIICYTMPCHALLCHDLQCYCMALYINCC